MKQQKGIDKKQQLSSQHTSSDKNAMDLFDNLNDENIKIEIIELYNKFPLETLESLIGNFKKNGDSNLRLYPKCVSNDLLKNADLFNENPSETLRHILMNILSAFHAIVENDKLDESYIEMVNYDHHAYTWIKSMIIIYNDLVSVYLDKYIDNNSLSVSSIEDMIKLFSCFFRKKIHMSVSLDHLSKDLNSLQLKQSYLLLYCFFSLLARREGLSYGESELYIKGYNKDEKYIIDICAELNKDDKLSFQSMFQDSDLEPEGKGSSEYEYGIVMRLLFELGRTIELKDDGDKTRIFITIE